LNQIHTDKKSDNQNLDLPPELLKKSPSTYSQGSIVAKRIIEVKDSPKLGLSPQTSNPKTLNRTSSDIDASLSFSCVPIVLQPVQKQEPKSKADIGTKAPFVLSKATKKEQKKESTSKLDILISPRSSS
jgi:hypothetical protein